MAESYLDIERMLDRDYIELPIEWEKRFKSRKIKRKAAENGMWVSRPLPTSEEGKKILRLNDMLFKYCDTLDDLDYAFEPVDMRFVELVPGNVLLYEYSGRNVFENSNEIVSTLSGIQKDCYIQVSENDITYDNNGIEINKLDDDKYHVIRDKSESSMSIIVQPLP